MGCRFQQKTCNISETRKIGPRLPLVSNRKSHGTRFRLVPKSTNLNDGHYELCFKIHAFSETAMNIWMNTDLCYQRQICRSMTLVYGNILRCMRIFAGIPWRGASNEWGCRKRQFSVLSLTISSADLEVRPTLLSALPLLVSCNYQLVHYSGFCRISPSILNRFKPNLQA